MINRLNSNLRKLIILAAGVFLLLKLIAGMETDKDNDDGFQTKEFDDIW